MGASSSYGSTVSTKPTPVLTKSQVTLPFGTWPPALLPATSTPPPQPNVLYQPARPSTSKCTNNTTIGTAQTRLLVEITTVPFLSTWQSGSSISIPPYGEADDEIVRVDDALSANPNTANWFKVAELGLIKTDYWGTDSLNANCGRLAFKVPECIPSGDYLIKAEGKPVLSPSKNLTDRLFTY